MATYSNTAPIAQTDGIPYCTSVPLTTAEADLGDSASAPAPIPVLYGQVVVAVVQFSVNGVVNVNKSYVVMQTDLGDGVWVDVAWAFYSQAQAPETHVLCGGGLGAMNNAFKVSRASGQLPSPQADGSNQVPLGGRVRFVGGSNFAGGSSSAPGVTTAIRATIKYKLMDPR